MNRSLNEIRVKDVMNRHVVSVAVGDTVQDVLNLMVENRVSALPVVDRRERCVGIISISDLIDLTRDLNEGLDLFDRCEESAGVALVEKLAMSVGHERVDSLMTEAVVAVSSETLVVKAAQEMLRHRVHRLPVVDKDNQLLGILSTTDVLKALVGVGAA
jgi:CBS domain-containing protein